MREARRTPYPSAAVDWMLDGEGLRVLDLGTGTGAFARMAAAAGHHVYCVDRDVASVSVASLKLGTRVHVAGQAESLPFRAAHFDVVSAAQTLHKFAPGLALAEMARVLRPGGHLSVIYNTRDDTVPWVKRLTRLMRAADPESMTGDFGDDSVDTLTDSPYFDTPERKDFRNWVPITRDGLIEMVRRRPATEALDEDAREQLLSDVGALYDSSARPPEPLLLPFQASCWRAGVDHTELRLDAGDDGLEIPLGL